MTFSGTYRASLYLMLFLGTLILNMDAEVAYAKWYPVGMAVAAVLAFFGVDRDPKLGLAQGTANILGVGALFLVYLEYRADPNQLVLACGHWLYYLMLVKMFRPKAASDDWYLIMLSLMQVLVGSFLSQSDRVGLALLAWAILGVWVLKLFYLEREARRFGELPEQVTVHSDPYPGLFRAPFLVATVQASAITLLLGGFIFLILPRGNLSSQPSEGGRGPRSLTGFDDEVQLGQLGEILENEAVVMSVELVDEEGHRVEPKEELLWRGVTLSRYEGGRWTREPHHAEVSLNFDNLKWNGPTLTQNIRMEATTDNVVFALRPVLDVRVSPAGLISMNGVDGSLKRGRTPRERRRFLRRENGPLHYTIVSAEPKRRHVQPGESPVAQRFARRGRLLSIGPAELEQRFREISDPIVADIPATDSEARALALERYLRDSGEFGYTLSSPRGDRELDPILDFLVNTRMGHCEYYASALAMLLRSQGIPSRVVNGFKGGDWNEIARVITVRQKHAHSWVEAYLGQTADDLRQPIWLTLDPTPSAERTRQVSEVGGVPWNIRQLGDFFRYLWVFWVAGFNADRQESLLYGPIRQFSSQAREGFRIMGYTLTNAWRWLTNFPDPSSFISIRGFIVTTLALSLLVGLYRLFSWIGRLAIRLIRALHQREDALAGAMGIYARLVRLLKGYGLERPDYETPREFAQRAAVILGDRAGATAVFADVPIRVVEAFYQVRFGGVQPPKQTIESLDARLDELEAGLRPTRA